MKKVSKGKLFGVTTVVDDGRLKAMKKSPEIIRAAMLKAAFAWHTGLLPKHFLRGAHGEYGYAERSRMYLRKKGSNPDLVKTGGMKAQLLAKAAAKNKGLGVELKLTARSLNFVPNSANPLDVYVQRKNGKSYPNMKREIRQVTDAEMTLLKQIVAEEMADAYAPSDTKKGKSNGSELSV